MGCDQIYRHIYQRRPNSAFPRIFYDNHFCRLMPFEGIPGSGADDLGRRLAEAKNLQFRERPDIYYLWHRYGEHSNTMQAQLTKQWQEGTGPGNWFQEKWNMHWDKVYKDKDDWKMLCKVLSWQLRSYRMAHMDNVVDHLLGMQGICTSQSYWSMRAEIHAIGETGRIPQDMYQSFIDQWHHMEGMTTVVPLMVYVDIDVKQAWDNIQKSDKYTDEQKRFYNIGYLTAYKEGYEKFVLPHVQQESMSTLVHRVKRDSYEFEDLEDFEDDLLDRFGSTFHPESVWHPNQFMATPSYSTMYNTMHMHNFDMGYNQAPTGIEKPDGIHQNLTNGEMTNSIIEWRYPRDVVDDGHHWMSNKKPTYGHEEIEWLNERGYGFRKGMNKDEISFWEALWVADKRKVWLGTRCALKPFGVANSGYHQRF